MRHTPLKTFVLTTLLEEDGFVPDLWVMAGKAVGKEVPIRTFYDTIYSLRDDGLVHYQSRQMTDRQMNGLLKELAGGPIAEDVPVDDVGLVRLTTRGRAQAELLTLKELIPAPRQREAARHIQRLQQFIVAVGSDSRP